MQSNYQLKSGIFGGTILSTIINISFHDILTTCFMAIIGATVSFFVSYLLKNIFLKKNKNK
jgi:hypothetical protein|tara:strand:- start:686 stop:868 length:183 start_codon:yes stop_codon:yes gene_type:complete